MIKVVLHNKLESTSLAMRLALETYPGIKVIGIAQDQDSVVEVCASLNPDVIIVELMQDDPVHIGLIRHIHDEANHTPVIVLSYLLEIAQADLYEWGASACVSMTDSLEEVVNAIYGVVSASVG